VTLLRRVYVLDQINPGPWGPTEPIGIYSTFVTALSRFREFVPDAEFTYDPPRRRWVSEQGIITYVEVDQ
jgi:hypothetical protein